MELTQLKKRLWIADTSQDEKLKIMLSDAQSALEQQLGYKIEPHKKTEWISIGKSAMLFLSAPIISVENVGNYEVKRYQKNILYLTDKVKGEVEIHYTAGFEQIPEALETALVERVKEALRIEKNWGELEIQSKQIDTLRISYFSRTESEKASIVKQTTNRNQLLKPFRLLSCKRI